MLYMKVDVGCQSNQITAREIETERVTQGERERSVT